MLTRVGLAAFVAAVAMLMAPGWVPVAWWALMVAGQLVDRAVARPILGRPDSALGRGRKAAYLASTVANSALFSSINLYLWTAGGHTGQWFALLVACGTMVHITLKHFAARP